ncbi:MAG: hypothetical protein IPH32_11910 [Bacteroidetes bacterium]|nr:hypothetical protein [Bacteroidota bacterium]
MTFSLKGMALMVILLFCFTANFSQDVTVDFEGRVSNDNMTLSESIVQVLQDGKLLTSFKTDQNGSYNIYLPLGSDYLISISKNDYVQKYFSVSTKNIPQDQAGVKLPAIRADVDLFKYYDGVDYSMFDEPINKFYYSSKKGNFDYDKEYLKAKKEEMRKVKLAEKKAIQLALQKNAAKQKELEKSPEKKEDVAKLNEEKKVLDEKLAKQSLMLKLIEEEEKPILKTKEKNEVELNIVAANNDASTKVIDKKVNDLIAKHKQTVSEEQQKDKELL